MAKSSALEQIRLSRKRARLRARGRKKDPLFVGGVRPRPIYIDYKDVDFLKRFINRQAKIIGRRKTGCHAVTQHAIARAIKRARIMGLLPFVPEYS